jgi:hypothetical protein
MVMFMGALLICINRKAGIALPSDDSFVSAAAAAAFEARRWALRSIAIASLAVRWHGFGEKSAIRA